MVALYAIAILRCDGDSPRYLELHTEISSFSFFSRYTVKQIIMFFVRQVSHRTKVRIWYSYKKIIENN